VITIFPDRSFGRRNPKIENEFEPSLSFPTALQVGSRTADIMSDLLCVKDDWRTGWKPTRKKRPRWVLAAWNSYPDSWDNVGWIRSFARLYIPREGLPPSRLTVITSVRQGGSMMPKHPTVNTTEVVRRCDMRTVS